MSIDSGPRRRLGRPPKGSIAVATPDRLLDAGFTVCVERGVDALTLAEVATRAGVTANAVYKHFDSKAALLVATAKVRSSRCRPTTAPSTRPIERGR